MNYLCMTLYYIIDGYRDQQSFLWYREVSSGLSLVYVKLTVVTVETVIWYRKKLSFV